MVRPASVTVVLVLLAPFGLANDGVLEINQACAVNTGCFPGDTGGFPVTIDGSAGRSYRLTSDLTVPSADTSGIVVTISDVGIDLNNFAILGPCPKRACTPPGFDSFSTAPRKDLREFAGLAGTRGL